MKVKKLILIFAIFIILIVLFDRVLMPLYVRGEEVTVPNVVGMTLEQAQVVIKNAGLEPVNGGERYDTKFPKGTVILQRPIANKTVKVGRRIYLIVSGGNIKVSVPDVRHKRIEEATVLLNRAGLTLGEIFEDTLTDIPKGLISVQSIQPNEQVEKGTAIDVWISNVSSFGNIEIPSLVGKSLTEAKQLIESKNLKVGKIVYQPSMDFLPNTVIYQYPSAGSFVEAGTQIDLIVVKEKLTGKEIIE
ncbi:MAG: PASTA domain-containing protein [Ignavibacteria bacterium]